MTMIHRRTFIKYAFAAGLAPAITRLLAQKKSHILTLSFDDGFKKSFYKIADLYERYNLSACLNIIASGHLPEFQKVDDWILPELMGSFEDWNHLQGRGHEIMPHSWKHLNLAKQPYDDAVVLIDKCLDYFEEHLDGFHRRSAVFNFPFNASTPELESYVLTRLGGLRSRGPSAVNKIPNIQAPTRLACWSDGPQNQDAWVEEQVADFLASEGGWLILNLHGLKNEGWGPISEDYLDNLLGRLVGESRLAIMPAGAVLKEAGEF